MQEIINGLAVGGIYGLLAVAFSVVYGVLGMVNFAFGEIFMFGAFGGLVASQTNSVIAGNNVEGAALPAWMAILIGVIVGSVVGWLIERIAYRPLRNAPILSMLITAIAVSMLLRAVATFLFGAAQVPVERPDLGDPLIILGARVQRIDVVVLTVAVLVTLAFWAVIRFTPIGRAIRATAEDKDAARLMGIGVDRVISTTFILGSAMAAIAGLLYSQRYGFAAATMGFLPGLKALVAAVLGGIGSIPGAFVGGLVLGISEEFAAAYVPQGSAYRDVIAFGILVIILWLRPQGLLGRREVQKV
ncbi:general L-amino acid ABC transporter membrane protein [Leucobacter luti]|uniref:branched-chain amino acid ABC transporter permease n=1 Tax=Leucobacter luti TaxID=340320 RepID=UPI00104DA1EF|nr:branched-chain amino acid ABC transporter permease [Leucobacter luti]MCW2288963.1 branched-subunit amino acid ABC-type transport system permease component [Leucobacter luti]TCK44887.1 general L-amino acid ABC transporter membrane protein [Leucobacter luti]